MEWVIEPVCGGGADLYEAALGDVEVLIDTEIAIPIIWRADIGQDVGTLGSEGRSREAIGVESLTLMQVRRGIAGNGRNDCLDGVRAEPDGWVDGGGAETVRQQVAVVRQVGMHDGGNGEAAGILRVERCAEDRLNRCAGLEGGVSGDLPAIHRAGREMGGKATAVKKRRQGPVVGEVEDVGVVVIEWSVVVAQDERIVGGAIAGSVVRSAVTDTEHL